jgi:hypothetical protein
MDLLALIHRARDVGLRLEIAGNALKITGPKEAEPLVRLLAEHKTQVLEALTNSGLRKLRELRELVPQSVEEEGRRDRFEERAPILEFDAGLPRAEAEAIAHQEMAAGICETAQAEHDANPYTSVLAALRAKCPAYVPEDRWRQAIEDATAFLSEWGERAQAFGWTARELFGLHPVPERPAANYSRLSRYDTMGLIWLLHGRPVTSLTEMEAAIEGVVKVYRKLNKPALGPLGDSLDDWGTL